MKRRLMKFATSAAVLVAMVSYILVNKPICKILGVPSITLIIFIHHGHRANEYEGNT